MVASNATITEGDTGTQPITFTVTKLGSINAVSFTINIGSEATAGLDYQNVQVDGNLVTSGVGTIDFGTNTTAEVTLEVIGDYYDEDDEDIRLIIGTYASAVKRFFGLS